MSVTLYTPSSSQIVHEARVDFRQRVIQSMIHIVQYDKSLPVVAVELYSNGQKWALPDAVTAVKVRWGKRDHTYVHRDVLGCNEDRTIVYMEITEQMTIFYGEHNPVLEVLIGDNVACSSYIPFYIDRNPIQRNDIESIDDPSIVEELQREIATKLGKENFGEVLTEDIYDPTSSYEEGDVVYYGSYLYEALVDIPSPAGNFDETKWKKTTVTNLLLNEGVASVNGRTGDVVLTKNDVGLGNVDNTSDANKPVSTAQQAALDLKEDKSNKITSWGTPTNTQYPSAKLVKDDLDKLEAEMNEASTDVTDSSMYKVSGVSDGLALPAISQMEVLRILGNTVAWNQLAHELSASYWAGGSATFSSGVMTFTPANTYDAVTQYTSLTNGHKYLVKFMAKNNTSVSPSVIVCYLGDSSVVGSEGVDGTLPNDLGSSWQEISFVGTYNQVGSGAQKIGFMRVATVEGISVDIKGVIVIDLTQLFPDNTPTSITDPRVLWAIQYATLHPEYNAGELIDGDGVKLACTGRQLWDEVAGFGRIDGGGNDVSGNGIRSANYIAVIPNASYYEKLGSYDGGTSMVIYFYDRSKNFLSSIEKYGSATFETPSNCCFIRFAIFTSSAVTAYNHDITISLWYASGQDYDEYFPYEEPNVCDTGNEVLYGVDGSRDSKKPDGTITRRRARVDLATLAWTYDNTYHFFRASLPNKAITQSYQSAEPMICSSYTAVSHQAWDAAGADKVICGLNGTSDIGVRDSSLSTTDTPTGVLEYPLATPTTEQGTPFPNAMVVYQGGTEWQINDGAPAVIEKNYDISIKDQVLTNVRVDARQEEEIAELKQADLKTLYNLGAFDTVDTSNKDYDLITRATGVVDLGTLNWTYSSDPGDIRWYSNSDSSIPSPASSSTSFSAVCSLVPVVSIKYQNNNLNENCISRYENVFYCRTGSSTEKPSGILQYRLSTPYTEKVIKNRPLDTLDQNGSMFVRKEWEKGQNVFNKDDSRLVYNTGYEPNPTSPTGTDWVKVSWIQVKPNTTYCVNKRIEGYALYNGSTWSNGTASSSIITTLSDTQYILLLAYIGGTQSVATSREYWSNLMLVEGSHAYPYQPHNGAIVHEKDIENVARKDSDNNFSSRQTIIGTDDTMLVLKAGAGQSHCNTMFLSQSGYQLGNIGFNTDYKPEIYSMLSHSFVDLVTATDIGPIQDLLDELKTIVYDNQYPAVAEINLAYSTYYTLPKKISGDKLIMSAGMDMTKVKGRSYVVNQIFNYTRSDERKGVLCRSVSGLVTITGTSSESGNGGTFSWTDFVIPIGHKVIVLKDFNLPEGSYLFDQYNIDGGDMYDITQRVVTIVSGYLILQLRIGGVGVTYNIVDKHIFVVDLTQWFGSNDAIPADLLADPSLFTKKYWKKSLPFDTGHIEDSKPVKVVSVGTNLIELTNYTVQHSPAERPIDITIDGNTMTAVTQLSGNGIYFPVNIKQGKTYTFSITTNNELADLCVSATNDSSESGLVSIATHITTGSYTFTADKDYPYIRIWCRAGTTYVMSSIMLNLGSTALPFQPFSRKEYPIWEEKPNLCDQSISKNDYGSKGWYFSPYESGYYTFSLPSAISRINLDRVDVYEALETVSNSNKLTAYLEKGKTYGYFLSSNGGATYQEILNHIGEMMFVEGQEEMPYKPFKTLRSAGSVQDDNEKVKIMQIDLSNMQNYLSFASGLNCWILNMESAGIPLAKWEDNYTTVNGLMWSIGGIPTYYYDGEKSSRGKITVQNGSGCLLFGTGDSETKPTGIVNYEMNTYQDQSPSFTLPENIEIQKGGTIEIEYDDGYSTPCDANFEVAVSKVLED